MQLNGTNYFYTLDHLGSVRELVDSSGNIQARYDYDPYGRVTKIQGSTVLDADFQYAGYYEHQTSGLSLTKYRAYDPNTGRWINRDLIAERGGLDLYGYCTNDPINTKDQSGNDPTPAPGAPGAGGLWGRVSQLFPQSGLSQAAYNSQVSNNALATETDLINGGAGSLSPIVQGYATQAENYAAQAQIENSLSYLPGTSTVSGYGAFGISGAEGISAAGVVGLAGVAIAGGVAIGYGIDNIPVGGGQDLQQALSDFLYNNTPLGPLADWCVKD